MLLLKNQYLQVRRVYSESQMEFTYNKNTGLYYKSAKELFLPVQIRHYIEGFSFQLGKTSYFFRGFETPFNNSCSTKLTENKYCANKILENANIVVPKAVAICKDEFENGELENIISDLKFPLVLKPTISSLGRDVYCKIPDLIHLKTLMTQLYTKKEWLTIEEFHGNLNSYRVLVFNKKIIGVVQRYPAHVIGDGVSTITELVALSNIKRAQLSDELAPILLDEECHFRLKELDITPDYIPAKNERLVLCYTCNASRGGTYEALNTRLDKKSRQFFINIASILNLNIAGIDVECVDINSPKIDSESVIIEVNPGPSVRIHENTRSAKPNRVTKKMVRSIIYRHPLSFVYVLYKNKQTALYVRGFIFLVFFSIICQLIVAK